MSVNAEFYTETGSRPDLAVLEVNAPEGYIGSRIVPAVPVMEKAGSTTHAVVTADDAAQTSRAAGVAPTKTRIAPAAKTYACTEVIKRAAVTPDEVKQFGGIARADEIGAKWAKRQVMAALEGHVRAAVFPASPSLEIGVANLRVGLQGVLQGIRLFPGVPALVASTTTLKTMVQLIASDNAAGPIFARIVTGTNSAEAVMGLSFEAWRRGLAMYLGVDDVLAGDDAIWNAGNAENGFAVVKLDPVGSELLRYKYEPVFARRMSFLPDGENEYGVGSIADHVAKDNLYDASAWSDVVIMNSAAAGTFTLDTDT